MNSTHGGTIPSVKSVGMTASLIASNVMNAVIGFIINVLDFQKTSSNYIAPNSAIEIIFVVKDVKCGLSPLVFSVVTLPLMMSQLNAHPVTKTILHLLMFNVTTPNNPAYDNVNSVNDSNVATCSSSTIDSGTVVNKLKRRNISRLGIELKK